jgi:hypothetical protein
MAYVQMATVVGVFGERCVRRVVESPGRGAFRIAAAVGLGGTRFAANGDSGRGRADHWAHAVDPPAGRRGYAGAGGIIRW